MIRIFDIEDNVTKLGMSAEKSKVILNDLLNEYEPGSTTHDKWLADKDKVYTYLTMLNDYVHSMGQTLEAVEETMYKKRISE